MDENQPAGTVVGQLSSTDADGGDAHLYSLAAGGADNAAFTIVGNELRTAASFDYEAQNSYSVLVRTDDQNGGIFEGLLTVTVADAYDAPVVQDGVFSVSEDAAAGTSCGKNSPTAKIIVKKTNDNLLLMVFLLSFWVIMLECKKAPLSFLLPHPL